MYNDYFRYRVSIAQLIDRMSYECGNARRTHRRVYDLYIRPLLGIGRDSFHDYLRCPCDELTGYRQPAYIEIPIRIMVLLVDRFGTVPATDILKYLLRAIERAASLASENSVPDAYSFEACLKRVVNESMERMKK